MAAVSGGADSIAMLNALAVKDILKSNLHCLHVNHGIRSEAECSADADFVREFCEKLNIDCRVIVIPPGKIASFARRKGVGIEAAARHFRHRALRQRARELGDDTRIFIAHTQDDLLETLLMRILRGAGPQGLSPMCNSRNARIVRPLLETTRADVLKYLKEKNISWREDSSNSDDNYLRNKIRHSLIPLLNKDFPNWKKGLLSMTQTQALTAAFISQEAQKQIIWQFGAAPPLSASTDAQNFYNQSLILREESLFIAVDKLLSGRRNFKSVKRAAVRKFCKGGQNAADLGQARVFKTAGKIQISLKKKAAYEKGFSLLINEPGLYTLGSIAIEACPYAGQDKKGGFCSALPVAVWGSYSGSKGSLAVHGAPREAGAGQTQYLVTINIGGKNV